MVGNFFGFDFLTYLKRGIKSMGSETDSRSCDIVGDTQQLGSGHDLWLSLHSKGLAGMPAALRLLIKCW